MAGIIDHVERQAAAESWWKKHVVMLDAIHTMSTDDVDLVREDKGYWNHIGSRLYQFCLNKIIQNHIGFRTSTTNGDTRQEILELWVLT